MSGNAQGVIVKLSLEDKFSESLRISKFNLDRFVITDSDRLIEVELSNDGERSIVPDGEIVFYNSSGQEFSSKIVNTEGIDIPPGESRELIFKLPFEGGLGKFKANLAIQYGQNQTASVFDTAQFFVFPLPWVLVAIAVIIILSLLLTYLIRKVFSGDNSENDQVPLYVRKDREHIPKDHDINLQK
jgi:hypothetical protein